ncbi:MAG: single-stranded-DNA-specific exonuclease RecJ [Firmicutes bacterium]|nr:single-stranded-DNA-specific exonuclease RecJ [Bacillota bacterium]
MARRRSYIESRCWTVAESENEEAARAISSELGLSDAMGRLLCVRNCTAPETARAFLGFENGRLHDPFLLPDMDAAAERIIKAVNSHEKITVYGDYDVDGVTSTAAMCLYLRGLCADVDYYIPSRGSEGYGVNAEAVRKIIEGGTTLIITVDTGVTASEETELARSLGCDVVVTDHHECPEALPTAVAVINPQRADSDYPFRGLAGVGVVYKVLCALEARIRSDGDIERAVMDISYKYADLVAIGTISDVMPMTDENRLIIRYGLGRLEKAERVGTDALIRASMAYPTSARPKINSGYVGYTLGPRINAAGRMANANPAAELFMTDDRKRADELAHWLCDLNRDRQQLENAVAHEAYDMIERNGDDKAPAIVISGDDWHPGIIGIVSSRVAEKYSRPSLLITFSGAGSDEKSIGRGSGRSVGGIDLVDALSECSEYLVKYGGHSGAAGFSIERGKLGNFKEAFLRAISKRNADMDDADLYLICADTTLCASEITLRLAGEISALEPFGSGNQTPLFSSEGLVVRSVTGVGSGKHTKLFVSGRDEMPDIAALCFSVSPEELDVLPGDTVDLAYNLEKNEFRGLLSVQMIVRAVRKSKGQLEAERDVRDFSDSVMSLKAEKLENPEIYIPKRSEFAQIYVMIRHEIAAGRHEIRLRRLLYLAGDNFNYTKIKIIVSVFDEMNVFIVENMGDDVYGFSETAHSGRINLDKSDILLGLKQKYT